MVRDAQNLFVLTDTGYLYGGGSNYYGGLGLGTDHTNSVGFAQLATGVSDVACGSGHTLILKGDVAYSVGLNSSGQLGNGGTTDTHSFAPMLGAGSSGVTAVYAGGSVSFVNKGGTLYACGYNYFGQLGIGSTSNVSTLTACSGAGSSGVDDLECGVHTIIRKGDAVWGCGYNIYGQLGIGATGNRSTFTACTGQGASGVSKIAVSYTQSHILKSGAVYGAGYNNFGQIGDGTTTQRTSFTAAINAATAGVTDIAGGMYHSVMLKGGAVYATGNNSFGQHGDNSLVNTTQYTIAVGDGASGVTALSRAHSCSSSSMAKGNFVYSTGFNYDKPTGQTLSYGGLVIGAVPSVQVFTKCKILF